MTSTAAQRMFLFAGLMTGMVATTSLNHASDRAGWPCDRQHGTHNRCLPGGVRCEMIWSVDPCHLLRVLYAVEEEQPMPRQPVGARPFTQ